MHQNTRLFYITESNKENKELWLTRDEATEHINKMPYNDHPVMFIAEVAVEDVYQEENGQWNYEDHAETFKIISYI